MSKHIKLKNDVPIEVVYKYLLKDYHREQEKVTLISNYAKELEKLVEEFKKSKVTREIYKSLLESYSRLKKKHKALELHRVQLENILKYNGIPFKKLEK